MKRVFEVYDIEFDENGGTLHVMNEERMLWLSEQVPGFRKKTLCVFDYLLFGNTYRHKIYKDAILITDSVLKCVGSGVRSFKSNNDKLGLFYTNGEYDKRSGVAMPWWYSDRAIKIIADYYSTNDFMEMALKNTKEYKLRLDIANLGRAIEKGLVSAQNVPEAFKLISAVAENPTCLARYERAECGRLFTKMGDYSLQRMPKELRKFVMPGWHAYDISNCHVAIACTYGDFPTLRQYANDTEGFRALLSFELGVGIGEVKTALLAGLYGAGEHGFKGILGDKIDEFMNHDLVGGYLEDCKTLKPLVLKDCTNKKGSSSSRMSKVIMKKEGEVLDICVEGLYNPVLLFDGWITPKKIENLKEIEQKVLTNTGVCVTLTENEI